MKRLIQVTSAAKPGSTSLESEDHRVREFLCEDGRYATLVRWFGYPPTTAQQRIRTRRWTGNEALP